MSTKSLRGVAIKVLPPLIYWLLRGVYRTIKWVEVNPEAARGLWNAGQKMILAFWHNRMLLTPFFYRGKGIKVLISQHADGELISQVMRRFGFESIRGSSTRGGGKAFRAMIKSALEGKDVAITPDGPRGPKYKVQRGIVELAWKTGLPVVAVSYSTQHRYVAPSWDGLLIPRPFTRGVFIWDNPLWVEPDADLRRREEIRILLQKRMMRITDLADLFFSTEGPMGS